MDLNLTAPEREFRDALRAWLADHWSAESRKQLAEMKNMGDRFTFLRAWQKKVYEGGWAGVAWPKEYGGRGATLIEQVIFLEELARAAAPPLGNVLGVSLIGPTIIPYGTEAQQIRFLANILSGDEIW